MGSDPEIKRRTQVWQMKHEELKDACEKRGLDSDGYKKDLQNRLFEKIWPSHSSSQSQTNVTDATNVINDSNVILLKNHGGPVYKRIPKASRLAACIAFTKLLLNVIHRNDIQAWSDLINFARGAIGGSIRGGRKKRKSQATILNKRCIYVWQSRSTCE